MASTFGLLVAALGNSPATARGVTTLAVLMMVMLGGAWVPTFIFPAWLQQFTVVVPVRWAVDGLDAMTWRGIGLTGAIAAAARAARLRGGVRGDGRGAVPVGRSLGIRHQEFGTRMALTARPRDVPSNRACPNLVQDVRYAIRLLREAPRLRGRRHPDPGARHRRHHSDLHGRQRRTAEPAAFRDAERLVEVRIISRNDEGFPLPDADFLAWRSQNQTC